MKSMKTLIIGLAVVFLTTGAAYAQTQGQGQERGSGQKERVFKELNLSPEQQEKLQENRKAQRQEMQNLRTALKENQVKLREALKDPAATKATVEPLASNIKALQAQLVDHMISGIFAVKEILTPEQYAKFQQMTQKRGEDRKGRFQNWREKRKGTD